VSEVLEIEGADKASYAGLDLVGLAVVNGPELDPKKVQALPEPGEVLLIAQRRSSASTRMTSKAPSRAASIMRIRPSQKIDAPERARSS
jgi:hypothetical protein